MARVQLDPDAVAATPVVIIQTTETHMEDMAIATAVMGARAVRDRGAVDVVVAAVAIRLRSN